MSALDETLRLASEVAARRVEGLRRHASPLDLARAVDPATRSSPALELISSALVELMAEDSPHDALFVAIPPQEGKSTLCARRLPAWVLDREPDAQIAIVSYQEDIAVRWGREIKRDITLAPPGTLHIDIRRDSSAAGRWDTDAGGGLFCAGIGGPLTGRTVNRLLVIDDPVKDRAAAESQVVRDAAWDWYESVGISRLGPRTRVVLIMTRWHEDDLAGRIFSRPSSLSWREIIIPAITDDGRELESVRDRKRGYFAGLRATMSPYVFSGLYQQTPSAPEGNFFRRQTFRYWRQLPPWNDGRERIGLEGRIVTLADCWKFITMDFAASQKSSADWTVASAWAITGEGDLVLLDRVRSRVPDHEHFALALPLMVRHGIGQVYVESNWWSSTFVSDARDHGIPVALVRADTDKLTRAIPAAGRVHSGKVWFPAEAEWLDAWCDELAIFPKGTNDDQVDTLSYAARVQVNEWTPAPTPPRGGLSPSEEAVAAAHRAATGDGEKPFNAFDVPF